MLAVIPCDSLVMASHPLELKSENAEIKYQHSEVENYLRSGSYPEDADKRYKSGLRKRSKFFVLEGGHLHYVGGKDKKKPRLVVQSEEEQLRLVKTTHDTAHLGRDKILSQLNERYYWPSMYSQVCEYVSLLGISCGFVLLLVMVV